MSDPPRTTAPAPGPGSKRGISRWVVFGRLLLLFLAAGAVGVAFFLSHREDSAGGELGGLYICPMHPEVTSLVSGGKCPICRMDLEPVGGSNPSGSVSAPHVQSYDVVRRRGFGYDIGAPAWVESDGSIAAILYKDELAALGPDEHGVFSPSAGSAPVEVHLAPQPPDPWDRSTSRVHFQVDAVTDGHDDASPSSTASSRAALPGAYAPPPAMKTPPTRPLPGVVGWVRLGAKRRDLLVIPNAAVLESADGPYVLLASPDGRTVTKRSVEIGRVFGGISIVLSGLLFHDRVLIRSTFFFDAERRLQREPGVAVTP